MPETASLPTDSELLPRLREVLQEVLPTNWDFELRTEKSQRDRRIDAVLRIAGPDGPAAQIAIETRPSLYPRDAYALAAQLGSIWAASALTKGRQAQLPGYDGVLVMTRFLTPRTQDMLKEVGFSYADAAGNLRISTSRPAIFIDRTGPSENPWVVSRSLRSLKGAGSGAVVRALVDFKPPYTLRDLANKADLALGTASRVVNLLAEEAVLTRTGRGSIEAIDLPKLIRRWTEDYGMLESNNGTFFLEPRGAEVTLRRVGTYDGKALVTGSFAAIRRASVATPALLALYVDQVSEAAAQLELRPAPSGGNVVLLRSASSLPFARSWSEDGVHYAALSQVVADLLTSPGRGPVEGEALLEWMETHESEWRRD